MGSKMTKCRSCGSKKVNDVRCESCGVEVPIKVAAPVKCRVKECPGYHWKEKKGYSKCSMCNKPL